MNFGFMDGRAVRGDIEKHLFWATTSCIYTDVYEDRYEAKYFGLPVVRNLYISNIVLKMIRCLTGSQ